MTGVPAHEIDAIRQSDLFDAAWYLAQYPDVAALGMDPAEHYLWLGAQLGRKPSSRFDGQAYLAANPDIAVTGINPLLHYTTTGQREGRSLTLCPTPSAPVASPSRDEKHQVPPTPRVLQINTGARLVNDHALYDLILYPERPRKPASKKFDPDRLSIHWVIPEFSRGGGGHMTIFRMVRWLEFFGHECTVWVNHPNAGMHRFSWADDVLKDFQTLRAEVLPLDSSFFAAKGDVVFATSWDTVAVVGHAQGFKERFYFIQDYEPYFHARGARALAAEHTYSRDFACICASPWLEQLMREKHGRWARAFWLAYNQSIYTPEGRHIEPASSASRIAFYSRVHTERRSVELGLLALEQLAARNIDIHVDMFGGPTNFTEAPFSCTDHGILKSDELAALYRSADIGICFSSTNYSLVPQEMMACGLPVVELDVESTRAIFPDGVITLVEPDPTKLADAIEALLRNENTRQKQIENAKKWVGQFSWERAARIVESGIQERLVERGWRTQAAKGRLSAESASYPHASVIIPTYNGGELFKKVISTLRRQRTPWPFEIVVVDSTSTDGTAEFCLESADIVFMQIPQSEFSHGRTRNQAAAKARGEFIAFLTQDAEPADEFWLYNLVTTLERYPNAAGAFGRHVPWPEHSPFIKRDLCLHFVQFDEQPVAVSKATDGQRWNAGDIHWKQFLHFYSDNNSCLRRSIWQRIPYPDIPYGEDQVWARQIIEAGYEKVYARDAVVYHSHDYDENETRDRAEAECLFFKESFGYDLLQKHQDTDALIRSLNDHDRRWGIENNVPDHELERRMRTNRARIEGYENAIARRAHFTPSSHKTSHAGRS